MTFLRRRKFVGTAAGLVAGLSVSSKDSAAQQLQNLGVLRNSRLFDAQSRRSGVVRLLDLHDHFVTLFKDEDAQQFGLAGFTADGRRLWQYQLPSAFSYAALGTGDSGKTILIQALNLRLANGGIRASCLLAMDSLTGTTSILYDLGTVKARYLFTDDGALISVAKDRIQLWTSVPNRSLVWTMPYSSPARLGGDVKLPFFLNVEPIQKNSLALFEGDGATMQIVSLSKAVITEHPISSPEINSARLSLQSYRSTGISDSVNLPLLPVTGTNGNGLLYGIVYPILRGASASMLTISDSGRVVNVNSYHLPPSNLGLGHPSRILSRASEIGVVLSGGSVVWYGS